MFTFFFSVQGSLFSFPPDLLACLFIYPWSVGELSVAQLWNCIKEEYVIFQSARTGLFPVLALRSMRSLWWIFRKIETCWRGVFIKMFQDNWSISYKRDDSLGKCLVAATKFDAKFAARFATKFAAQFVENQNWSWNISTTSLYLLMRSDQKSFVSIPEHYLLNREQQTIFWPSL